MTRRPPLLQMGVPNNYFASRKHLDDAETAIDHARRIVVGKLSEASVTELAAVATAHTQIAQAAASQALVEATSCWCTSCGN